MKILKNILVTLCIGLIAGLALGSTNAQNMLAAVMSGSARSLGDSVTHVITDEDELYLSECEEEATHEHTYVNTSGPTSGYEYWAVIDKFRIYLEDDFEDVDISSLECSSGGSWRSCDGGSSSADGGTSITYNTVIGGDDYIEWEYGTSDSSERPVIPGYNDYDGDGVIDTPNDSDRQMGEQLTFDFDTSLTEGVAASYSAVQIYFLAYDLDAEEWIDITAEDTGETGWHWNGHSTKLITYYDCPAEDDICEDLTLEIDSSMISNGEMLSTDTLYNSIGMEVEAYDGDGTNITGDTEFYYQSFAYGTSTSSTPDGSGNFYTGFLNRNSQGNDSDWTSDSTVDYKNYTLPGETIYIEELSNPNVCNITYTLPYCADLTMSTPATMLFQTELPYEETIDIEVVSSYGDAWPFDVTYESSDSYATFDGNYTPLTTTDWEVDYYSEESGTVIVQADNDVAGACITGFTYVGTEEEIICDYLDITIPTSDISAADMAAGDVEITWESYLTDASTNAGPFRVYSSNSSGEFYDSPSGTLLSTAGEIASTTLTTVYYTGEDGDTIYVVDADEEWCADEVASIELEVGPYCEGMQWQNDYPYAYDDGEVFDITTVEGQTAMYDESVVCFDWWVNVFNIDLTWTANLQAELWEDGSMGSYASGVMSLDINETGLTTSGSSPVLGALDDPALLEYTGTVCVENFEEGNFLTLDVLGEPACFLDFEFPKLPEGAPVCEELFMDPDGYNMAVGDTDAGTIDITIDLGGSDSTWSGNLIIGALDSNNTPGSGELFYTDGSASEFADGHLEIPVAGTSETVTLTYVGGLAGDRVTAYVEGEEVPCIDFFEITQDEEQLACYELEFDGDTLEVGADYGTELCVDSDIEDQTLTVTYEGCDGVIEYNGSEYDELEITDIDGDACFDIVFTNVCEEAYIYSEIEDWEEVCWDELSIEEEPEEELPVCIDLSFDTDSLSAQEGEDFETELTLNSELEENTLIINYTGCDGDIEVEYDGRGVSGSDILEIPNIGPGTTNFDVTFTDVCSSADISAYIEEAPEDCYDALETEILEVGEFDKYIFTFNFASEKDSYADENVFFSHNEDRAFYTLEYDPAGGEDVITFFDEMWDGNLTGKKGDGTDSGGYISLATTKTELTTGNGPGDYYNYSTIEAYGFGEDHEHGTGGIKTEIGSWSDAEYRSFVPYIKWSNGDPAQMIYACSYDETTGEILTEETCYDEDYIPEADGQVVIHNTSWVEDQDDDAVIRVRYVGIVYAGINCSDESDECLTEEFQNDANVELYGGDIVLSSSARLVSLCSYLVTRNAGDVYLEVGLEGGSDISCIFVEEGEATSSDFRNVDALVILEADDGDESSSSSSSSIYDVEASYESAWNTVSICDSENENNVGNLSSYVCEIITSVSDLWKSATVEGTTESVVDQATRNAETTQSLSEYDTWNELYNDLYNQNNPDSGILYYQGSGEGDVVTLNSMTVPNGAWTLIVRDATLKIAGNIDYQTEQVDATNMPSIAFVVLGGDVYVSKATREMVGVYYTDQAFNGDERSAVTDDLTIYGSVYGYIQPLLDQANYVGSPTLDGGGVVVRYDSRIILNTPPGLSEYVDVNTEQAVN